ncbi:hypothetical protein C8J56DRAFT_1065680 [Mycena floridula]|nr:hypothetical protein C8J56DRAFT_1065680 [Mycena floridula]
MLVCCPPLLAFEVYLFGVRMLPLPWRQRRRIERHRHRLCISTWVARIDEFIWIFFGVPISGKGRILMLLHHLANLDTTRTIPHTTRPIKTLLPSPRLLHPPNYNLSFPGVPQPFGTTLLRVRYVTNPHFGVDQKERVLSSRAWAHRTCDRRDDRPDDRPDERTGRGDGHEGRDEHERRDERDEREGQDDPSSSPFSPPFSSLSPQSSLSRITWDFFVGSGVTWDNVDVGFTVFTSSALEFGFGCHSKPVHHSKLGR